MSSALDDKIRRFEATPLGTIWSIFGDACHFAVVWLLCVLARGNPVVSEDAPLDWVLWGMQCIAFAAAALAGLAAVVLTLLGLVIALVCGAPRDLLRSVDDPRSVFAKPPSLPGNARLS